MRRIQSMGGGDLPDLALNPARTKAAAGVYDPKTIGERRKAAGQCVKTLQYGIRTYMDEMVDAVNETYAAWPTRLYLNGLVGHVVYAGGLGSFGFKHAERRAAVDEYLDIAVVGGNVICWMQKGNC